MLLYGRLFLADPGLEESLAFEDLEDADADALQVDREGSGDGREISESVAARAASGFVSDGDEATIFHDLLAGRHLVALVVLPIPIRGVPGRMLEVLDDRVVLFRGSDGDGLCFAGTLRNGLTVASLRIVSNVVSGVRMFELLHPLF